MPSRSRGLALLVSVAFLVAIGGLPAFAAETANSEFVIIQPDDVLEDDLYAGAIQVKVQGTIDGDLVAFAAEEIVIDGRVTGSVTAVAPRVVITGDIDGALRVTSTALVLRGTVGRDLVAATVDVLVGSQSSVERDVQLWAWDAAVLGRIGRNLKGSMSKLVLAGVVEGDVDVSVGQLSVVDELVVGGDLGYRSDRQADGLENAEVVGVVVRKTPVPPNIRVRALGLFGRFMVIVFLTLSAVGVAWGWPDRTRAAVDRVAVSPIKTWAAGALVIFSPFVLAALAALMVALAPASASFPLLAIMAPVVLAALGLVFALSLVAGIPAAGRLGERLFRRLDFYGAMLAGSVVIGLLWLIPWVGWLVPLVILPIGLGGWIFSRSGTGSYQALLGKASS